MRHEEMSDLGFLRESAERAKAMHEYTIDHARDRLRWWMIYMDTLDSIMRSLERLP